MVEPGLTTRLRQHSRRSGMMVGLSMAIVIALCIITFIWIYVRVGPLLSDFIPAETASEATPASISGTLGTPDTVGSIDIGQSDNPDNNVTQSEPTPMPTPSPEPTPTPTPVWQPTHEISEGFGAINFRAGPSTVSTVLQVLQPGTPLQFLGERQPVGNYAWMRFETEDGTEGWVRDLDVDEIDENS